MWSVDPVSLRLFVAVCEEGAIARASEREFIAPSALSKRIADIEATFKTPLLVRSKRGVVPTPAGQALLRHARQLMRDMERLQGELSEYAEGARGHVRILANVSSIMEFLPEEISEFLLANEHIQVDIEERFSPDVVRGVAEGNADLGICRKSMASGDLEFIPYRQDHLAVLVNDKHPLARRTSIAFAETLDYEHLGLSAYATLNAFMQRSDDHPAAGDESVHHQGCRAQCLDGRDHPRLAALRRADDPGDAPRPAVSADRPGIAGEHDQRSVKAPRAGAVYPGRLEGTREPFRRGQELAGQSREVCHALRICVPIPSSSRQGHHPLREAGHGRAAWSRSVEPGSGRLHALRPPLSPDGRRLARRFSAAWQTPSGCRRGRWGRSAPVLASPVRENGSPVLEAGVRRRSGAGPMTPCLRAARRCAAALRADGHGS
nr:LysR family transcriptional regulator [Azotobacter chroococcum]